MATDANQLGASVLAGIDADLHDIVQTINRTAEQAERQEFGAVSPAKLRYDADRLSKIRRRIRILIQDPAESSDGVPLSGVHGSNLNGLGCRIPGCSCGGVVVPTRELASRVSGD